MSGADQGDVLVVFGITGDLAKKMTFQALYLLEHRAVLTCSVVGVGRDDVSEEGLRARARSAIEEAGTAVNDETFERLAARLSYVPDDSPR
jgi:glucose-6-phosphate 1-dehydrogenase